MAAGVIDTRFSRSSTSLGTPAARAGKGQSHTKPTNEAGRVVGGRAALTDSQLLVGNGGMLCDVVYDMQRPPGLALVGQQAPGAGSQLLGLDSCWALVGAADGPAERCRDGGGSKVDGHGRQQVHVEKPFLETTVIVFAPMPDTCACGSQAVGAACRQAPRPPVWRCARDSRCRKRTAPQRPSRKLQKAPTSTSRTWWRLPAP